MESQGKVVKPKTPRLATESDKVCYVDGYISKVYGKGLCNKYYTRIRINGKLELEKRDPLCSVEGCKRENTSKGLCKKHAYRFAKYGIAEPSGNCSEDGCERESTLSGLCTKHRSARNKRPPKVKQPRSMSDCELPVKAKGLCTNHYLQDYRLRKLAQQ